MHLITFSANKDPFIFHSRKHRPILEPYRQEVILLLSKRQRPYHSTIIEEGEIIGGSEGYTISCQSSAEVACPRQNPTGVVGEFYPGGRICYRHWPCWSASRPRPTRGPQGRRILHSLGSTLTVVAPVKVLSTWGFSTVLIVITALYIRWSLRRGWEYTGIFGQAFRSWNPNSPFGSGSKLFV